MYNPKNEPSTSNDWTKRCVCKQFLNDGVCEHVSTSNKVFGKVHEVAPTKQREDEAKIKRKEDLAIHYWLRQNYGKANKCEGTDCRGVSKHYDWALKKGCTYEKNRDSFIMLCRSCHTRYDMSPKKLQSIRRNRLATREWKPQPVYFDDRGRHYLRGYVTDAISRKTCKLEGHKIVPIEGNTEETYCMRCLIKKPAYKSEWEKQFDDTFMVHLSWKIRNTMDNRKAIVDFFRGVVQKVKEECVGKVLEAKQEGITGFTRNEYVNGLLDDIASRIKDNP